MIVCAGLGGLPLTGFPALTLLIAFGCNAFGPAGNWCWIPVGKRQFQLALYYAPMLLTFVCSLVRQRVVIC